MATGTQPASSTGASSTTQTAPAAQWFSDFAKEYDSTRKLLERYPDGKGEWRPHAKSSTLTGIATHVAEITGYGSGILANSELDFATWKRPPKMDSAKDLVAESDKNARALQDALARASVSDLDEICTVRYGDRVIASAPRRALLRGFVMNHLIHHRGQLGVYLRLLDVPIPGMYGPSADEPM
jgi:uncharacterized damage-inducible protein DinB